MNRKTLHRVFEKNLRTQVAVYAARIDNEYFPISQKSRMIMELIDLEIDDEILREHYHIERVKKYLDNLPKVRDWVYFYYGFSKLKELKKFCIENEWEIDQLKFKKGKKHGSKQVATARRR